MLFLFLLLAACGGAAETADEPTEADDTAVTGEEEEQDAAPDSEELEAEPAQEPTQTGVRLDWLFTGQQTPFFVARDNGHYEAAGLDVEIVEGSGSADAAKLVGTGEIDFGIVDASVLASARVEGIPVKTVAVLYQRSPITSALPSASSGSKRT